MGALVGAAKSAGRGTSHGARKHSQFTNGNQPPQEAYTNNSNIVQIGGYKSGSMSSTGNQQSVLNSS